MAALNSQKPEESVSNIVSFLEGFRLIKKDKEGTIEQFHNDFNRICDHLAVLKKDSLAQNLIIAPEFNVFRLLGVSRDEVHTHSSMLSHLFRPWASHGQQFLFLKTFLGYCRLKDSKFPFPAGEMENAHWDVLTEHITPSDGRLDIVIRSPDLGYIVVIENKVDAWEQTDQLKRYGQWMESQQRDYPSQGLIFLTLQGSSAYTAHEIPYLALSYHDDIYNWLAGVLDRIQAPNVYAIISQYTALVHNL